MLPSFLVGGCIHQTITIPCLFFPVLKVFCCLISGTVHSSDTGMKSSDDAGKGEDVPQERLEQ